MVGRVCGCEGGDRRVGRVLGWGWCAGGEVGSNNNNNPS